jgi:hypothetical protein
MARLTPLADQMSVSSVRAADNVLSLQRHAGTHSRRFLAYARVDEAGYQSLTALCDGPQLKLANQGHAPKELSQHILRVGG